MTKPRLVVTVQQATVKVSHIDHNFIYFWADPKTADKLGAAYVNKLKLWKIPNTLGGLEEILKYDNDANVRDYLEKKRAKLEELLRIKRLPDVPGDSRLRPYQRVDVEFLSRIPHGGIFNEMRTGKTPTVLGVVNKRGFKRVGIIAPASTLYNWQREVKFWTGRDAVVVVGNPNQRGELYQQFRKDEEFFFIISYEVLSKDVRLCKFEMDALIVDEIHKIRNRTTKQAKAVFQLGKRAAHRYALTGTPAVRAADDVWAILHFLYPDKFPSYWQFVERYMHEEVDYYSLMGFRSSGRAKREKELEQILEIMSTSRKQRDPDVMPWLPKKVYKYEYLDPYDKQRKVYESVRDTFTYKEAGNVLIDAPNPLAQLTRLRQIGVDPRLLGVDAGSIKTDYILEWLDEHKGEPLLVFSTFTEYLKYLEEVLKRMRIKVGRISGDTPAKKRQEVVDAFQNGELQVLLLNIKAAGAGLTLDRAETAIFLDREFNPADNHQAEDRLTPTRKERVHPMTVIILMLRDSYDEMVEKILQHKIDVTKIVNKGGLRAVENLYKELVNREHDSIHAPIPATGD